MTRSFSLPKNFRKMELQLKRILQNRKIYQQIHELTKKLSVRSSSTYCCKSLKRGSPNVSRDYWQQSLKALVNPHSSTSRQISAATSLLLTSHPYTCMINSQVHQSQKFHTNSSNCDKENQKQSSTPDGSGKQQNQNEDGNDKQKSDFERYLQAALLLCLAYLLTSLSQATQMLQTSKYISWNEFYHNILLKGEVKSIQLWMGNDNGNDKIAIIQVHDGAVIKGQVFSSTRYTIKIPKGFKFEEKIRELEDKMGLAIKDRIPITYGDSSSLLRPTVISLALCLAIGSVLFFTKFKKTIGKIDMDTLFKGMRQANFTRVDMAVRGSKVKAISFKDVAGLKEAKVEITEFVDYLTSPQRYQVLGAKTPRGAILLGPPGCGKTLLALALATEAKVPFLAMAGSEFVEMIGGVGAARVRSLFKEARARAPCIIYIDEIDAIGRKRGGPTSGGSGEDEHTLNQLLVEMDGIGTQEGVIMIAATNRADILDKALLRPGRFDRQIIIDLPTLEEREEIFMVYLNKLKLAQPASVYAKPLSKLTPGMSGADINNICNEAAIHAARDSNKVIDTKDFEYAVERVIAGVEKKTSQLSPVEKKVVAYHESGHALVGWLLEHTDALLRISILPRTNNALGFTQYLPTDQRLYSQEQLFERMCMALGGRAAESLVFNHVSTGAHDDLNRVTEMAYNQIRSYGMNARVGHLSFPSEKEQPGQRPYSQRLSQIMDEEARNLVTKAFLHTQTILQENRDKLNKLATTLLEKEVLSYDDVEALIGPPPYGKKDTIEPEGWKGNVQDTENSERSPKKMSTRKKK